MITEQEFIDAMESLIQIVEQDKFQGAINDGHGNHSIMFTSSHWDRGIAIIRARTALDSYRNCLSVGDLLEGGKESEV